MNIKSKNGFTLIEIIVVLLLISAIAGFAVPSYSKAIQSSRARDALIQLSTIHSANIIYEANAGQYLSEGGGIIAVAAINTGLDLNIIPGDMTYTYNASGGTYNAYATVLGGAFVISVDETLLGTSNPCCFCGTCPSVVENDCGTMCP